MILGEHTLPNGRRYLLTDTGLLYQNGEYPKGGILIRTWEPRCDEGRGAWVFIDHSPDEDCARAFLRTAARLAPLPDPVVEMALCEVPHVFLRPNQLYRFTVMPGCEACAKAAAPYA